MYEKNPELKILNGDFLCGILLRFLIELKIELKIECALCR